MTYELLEVCEIAQSLEFTMPKAEFLLFVLLELQNIGLLLCARSGVSEVLSGCRITDFLGRRGLPHPMCEKVNGKNWKGICHLRGRLLASVSWKVCHKANRSEFHDLWIKYHFNQGDVLSSQFNHCHQLHQGDWNHHYFSNWLARAGCGLATNAQSAH